MHSFEVRITSSVMAQVSDAVRYVRDELSMPQVEARLLDEIEEALRSLEHAEQVPRSSSRAASLVGNTIAPFAITCRRVLCGVELLLRLPAPRALPVVGQVLEGHAIVLGRVVYVAADEAGQQDMSAGYYLLTLVLHNQLTPLGPFVSDYESHVTQGVSLCIRTRGGVSVSLVEAFAGLHGPIRPRPSPIPRSSWAHSG